MASDKILNRLIVCVSMGLMLTLVGCDCLIKIRGVKWSFLIVLGLIKHWHWIPDSNTVRLYLD